MSSILPPELRDLVLATSAAAAGRVLLLLRHPPAKGTTFWMVVRKVVWEVPIVAAVGFLGYWIGAALNAGTEMTVILIAILAHYGPTKIDQVLDAMLARMQLPPK
jgi:hypothetical protein